MKMKNKEKMTERKFMKWLIDQGYYISLETERYQYGNGIDNSSIDTIIAEYMEDQRKESNKMTEEEATEGIKRLNLKNKHLRDPNKTRSFCGLRRTGKPMKKIDHKDFNMVRTNCIDCIIGLRNHLEDLISNHSDIYQGQLVYKMIGGMKTFEPINGKIHYNAGDIGLCYSFQVNRSTFPHHYFANNVEQVTCGSCKRMEDFKEAQFRLLYKKTYDLEHSEIRHTSEVYP